MTTPATQGVRTRLVLGAGVLACATLLLTACTGSSGTSAASGSSAPASGSSAPAASGSPSAPADPASSSARAGSAPVTPPGSPAAPARGSQAPAVSVAGAWSGYGPCPDLQVRLGLAQGTSAVTYQVIDFTNRGQVSCVLDGYPGINLAGGMPVVPIGLPAAQRGLSGAREITLQPGAVANALVQITNARGYSRATCGPVQASYLLVARPDGAAPARLAYATTACSRAVQMMQVSAVAVGTGG